MIEILMISLPIAAGVIGVWVNLNSTVARLKSRVVQLELQQNELKHDIKELLKSVHNIELMLAKLHAE